MVQIFFFEHTKKSSGAGWFVKKKERGRKQEKRVGQGIDLGGRGDWYGGSGGGGGSHGRHCDFPLDSVCSLPIFQLGASPLGSVHDEGARSNAVGAPDCKNRRWLLTTVVATLVTRGAETALLLSPISAGLLR